MKPNDAADDVECADLRKHLRHGMRAGEVLTPRENKGMVCLQWSALS